MSELTALPAWRALEKHRDEMAQVHMRELFRKDPKRFDSFSLHFQDILLDYSKNLVTGETMRLLHQLAEQRDVRGWIGRMFSGERINTTEDRPALHVALRNRPGQPLSIDGESILQQVDSELNRIRTLVDKVRAGDWTGYSGKPVTDVVNIGIGGSYEGPALVTEALAAYGHPGIRMHFISNVDGTHVQRVRQALDPETTLFIVVSKSFTTQESLTNAETIKTWLVKSAGRESAVARHFIAVTGNAEQAHAFGIDTDNLFPLWDWVGGRYSLWSAAGLAIALSVGMDRFEELLEGAHAMDRHFLEAPVGENLPITLALLGIWYINFFDAGAHAVLPYDQNLARLPAWLQQAEMESNGKHITREGQPVDYQTAPVIFGETGTNGQHSFFQLLHEGTRLIPADFLAAAETLNGIDHHHHILLANFFAQTEALMQGKPEETVRRELKAKGLDKARIDGLLPHLVFPGNHPTNSILYRQLTPHTLGAILALYEHKVYVQSVIWGIDTFDQWGVELGKQLANALLPLLRDTHHIDSHDSSTNGLVNFYKECVAHKMPGKQTGERPQAVTAKEAP